MTETIVLLESIAELEHLRQHEIQKVQEKDAQLTAVSKLLDLFNEDEGQLKGFLNILRDIFHADCVSLYEEKEEGQLSVRTTFQGADDTHVAPCEGCAIYKKSLSGRCVNIPDTSKFSCVKEQTCTLLHDIHASLLISGIQHQDVHYGLFIERAGGKPFSRSELGMFQGLLPILKQAISISVVRQEKNHLLSELRNAQKLEAVGHLAGGIAHEINTPSQYIGDNLHFLKEGAEDISKVLELAVTLSNACSQAKVCADENQQLRHMLEESDVAFLMEEIPQAIDQSIVGIQQIAKIVLAMKEFSHPGVKDKVPMDINRAIQTTLTVSRNEWKNVAKVETDLDEQIGPITCLVAEINQVILNLIVNAVHAIEDTGQERLGHIKIATKRLEDRVEVRVSDDGSGIDPEHQDHVFTPFYTTKDVGRGTGQGLALARDIIVNKHKGSLFFETEVGVGTTFIIQLPIV
ncbi:ATP-binding protein [Terasakiella sp. SH-1]|uniref:sensor histidine kinase n=1 Tax=Terasakiella sp. SH-1 TaxID=2560057 RepID=UPI00107348CB|nr:ATP-binding protein [Terasakiella sp. SH-1]